MPIVGDLTLILVCEVLIQLLYIGKSCAQLKWMYQVFLAHPVYVNPTQAIHVVPCGPEPSRTLAVEGAGDVHTRVVRARALLSTLIDVCDNSTQSHAGTSTRQWAAENEDIGMR